MPQLSAKYTKKLACSTCLRSFDDNRALNIRRKKGKRNAPPAPPRPRSQSPPRKRPRTDFDSPTSSSTLLQAGPSTPSRATAPPPSLGPAISFFPPSGPPTPLGQRHTPPRRPPVAIEEVLESENPRVTAADPFVIDFPEESEAGKDVDASASELLFERWRREQRARKESLHGPFRDADDWEFVDWSVKSQLRHGLMVIWIDFSGYRGYGLYSRIYHCSRRSCG